MSAIVVLEDYELKLLIKALNSHNNIYGKEEMEYEEVINLRKMLQKILRNHVQAYNGGKEI